MAPDVVPDIFAFYLTKGLVPNKLALGGTLQGSPGWVRKPESDWSENDVSSDKKEWEMSRQMLHNSSTMMTGGGPPGSGSSDWFFQQGGNDVATKYFKWEMSGLSFLQYGTKIETRDRTSINFRGCQSWTMEETVEALPCLQ